MSGQQFNIDTIANNLANVNTTGFKKSRADFQDLLYQTLRFAGTPVTAGRPDSHGHPDGPRRAARWRRRRSSPTATFKQTDNPLDLAIEGDGFFQILLPDGTIAYTRDGAFKKDADGRIVTSDGFPAGAGDHHPRRRGGDYHRHRRHGLGHAHRRQTSRKPSAMIELARFVNPAGLQPASAATCSGHGRFGGAHGGHARLDGFGIVAQGFLEMSNVQVVEEMVDMITSQRAYESTRRPFRRPTTCCRPPTTCGVKGGRRQ